MLTSTPASLRFPPGGVESPEAPRPKDSKRKPGTQNPDTVSSMGSGLRRGASPCQDELAACIAAPRPQLTRFEFCRLSGALEGKVHRSLARCSSSTRHGKRSLASLPASARNRLLKLQDVLSGRFCQELVDGVHPARVFAGEVPASVAEARAL